MILMNPITDEKRRFLTTMSHDLRTPMNAIINLTNMAKEDAKDYDKLLDDLDKMEQSNKFLLGLINDILDVTCIGGEQLKLHPGIFFYSEFSRYIDSIIVPLCIEKNIDFQWKYHKTDFAVYVDKIRFQQIFINLLSNAVKYSDPGSTIIFKQKCVIDHEKTVHMDYIVEDHGIGMGKEFQKHIFEPFEREHCEDARMGTGLGLTITKSIIDAMGGTINVESKIGYGTSVNVHLDLPLVPKSKIENHKSDECDKKANIYNFEQKKVLLVEDHILNREIAVRLLKKANLYVEIAKNGKEAVEKFLASPEGYYQAILMDIRMPVMDGIQAAILIREHRERYDHDLPIIAMTAECMDRDRNEEKEYGMNAYLPKPINPQKLYAVLKEFVAITN